VSVTTNEQTPERAGIAESEPVQVTVVEPTGNGLPEPGTQVVDTGETPPLASGAGKFTGAAPDAFCTWMSAGHVKVTAPTGGGPLGPSGLCPQRTNSRSPAVAAARFNRMLS